MRCRGLQVTLNIIRGDFFPNKSMPLIRLQRCNDRPKVRRHLPVPSYSNIVKLEFADGQVINVIKVHRFSSRSFFRSYKSRVSGRNQQEFISFRVLRANKHSRLSKYIDDSLAYRDSSASCVPIDRSNYNLLLSTVI